MLSQIYSLIYIAPFLFKSLINFAYNSNYFTNVFIGIPATSVVHSLQLEQHDTSIAADVQHRRAKDEFLIPQEQSLQLRVYSRS